MTTQTLQFYHQNASDLTTRYETADVAAMHVQLLDAFNDGSKLLEIGCGSGRDAAFMVSKGYDVTTVDGSQAMIDAAQELYSSRRNDMTENELATNGEQNVIIYNTADGKASVSLYSRDGMVWMNQAQLAELFATSKQNIGQHIASVLEDKELEGN